MSEQTEYGPSTLPTVRVVGAAVMCRGRLLVSCRAPQRRLGGYWEFPGGKLESGENYAQACVREIKEELKCLVIPGELVTVVEHDYEDFHLYMQILRCELKEGEYPRLDPAEHRALLWATRADLEGLTFVPADQEAVWEISAKLELA
ncbi:MAG: (deoxy)nucleoside triphosphate pyrophosphohydrolase [Succinivibrio sp.]|nr:(deoxy)nucleoside triphosphate pyrophosphohydrolase [Succinivibrio sp.]